MSPHHNSDLPPRHVLDAWDVPGPPLDLEERIMDAFPRGRTRGVSANPLSLVVPLVAGVAAAALVLIWMTLVRVDERPPSTPPVAAESSGESPPVAGAVAEDAERSSATLVLDVSPDAAIVQVDGRWIGGPAPFIATPLTVGQHRVVVRAEGRLDLDRVFELGPGTTELPITLASRRVVLSVETVPEDAKLVLEVRDRQGESRKEATKVIEIDRDPQARYYVEARAKGHLPRRVEVGFDGNPAQRLTVVLPEDASAKAAPPKRSASPLERFLGKSASKPTTPSVLPSPTPAPSSKKPRKKSPFLPFGSSSSKSKKKKSDPALATLRIGTHAGAAPAKVYIDGRFIGTTPQFNVKVKPGRHKVKWVWSTGKVITQSVTLVASESKVLKAG